MLIFSVDITSNIKTQKKLKKSLNKKERFISFLDIKLMYIIQLHFYNFKNHLENIIFKR